MNSSDKTDKPQTVATIDVNLQWPDFSKMNWNEEALYDHLHCCLCGSQLQFQHKRNLVQNTVNEEASCPSCRIKTRETSHTLQ